MLRQDLTPKLTAQQERFEHLRLDFMAEHGFEAESRWIRDPAGRHIYAMESGAGDCPKILVHGGLSEGSEWWPLAGRIEGRVVVADRPGCGLTHRPIPHRDRFREDAVRWLAALVEGLGTERVDLVGNSLGGYTSLVYALAHPHRVRRLVLVGAPAGLHRRIPFFIRLWGNPVSGAVITRNPITDPEKMRSVYQGMLVTDANRLPAKALEVSVAGGLLPDAGLYSYRMLRQVTDMGGVRRDLLIHGEVAHLDVPTRFVWGEQDSFCTPDEAGGIWDRMPNADLCRIDDAGHLPQLDQPDQVAKAVADHLSGAD